MTSTMRPQHSNLSGGSGNGPPASSNKSPVLVILPPTHKCPDLNRLLKLARKAFDDLSLNILDLNLRFAWVAGDELVRDDPFQGIPTLAEVVESKWGNTLESEATTQDACLVPAVPKSSMLAAPAPRIDIHPALPIINSNNAASYATAATPTPKPPFPSSTPAPPQPAPAPAAAATASSGKVRIKEAELTCFRVFVSDLAPTLTDADIFHHTCSDEIKVIGATFHPPRPIGPKRSLVRSATLAFAKAKHAKEYIEWIKQAASAGLLAGKLAGKLMSAYFLAPGMTPEDTMDDKKKAAFLGGDAALPFSLDAAALSEVPRNAIVPDDLPEADEGCWRFIVGNLIGSLTKKQILANIVPQGIVLSGATVRAPTALGIGRSELVRDIKLAFKTEVDAHACHAWIKKQAEPGGVVAKIVVPTGKISLNIPGRPLIPEAAAPDASQLLPANLRQVDPTSVHRLTVGNLNEHLSKAELLAGLIQPGISPVGMSMLPPQQLTGRPEKCASVLFEFKSERDVQAAHDWIRAEAVAGGRVANLMPPNVKIVAFIHKPAPVANGAASSPHVHIPSTHMLPAPISESPALLFANLPEVNPLAPYRLVVGNLLDSLSKAQLLSNLIPPGMPPLAVSVRPPVQLSGRPELSLNVVFQYGSEEQMQIAFDWVRAQAAPGGPASGMIVPGVKLICLMRKPEVAGDVPVDALPIMSEPPASQPRPISQPSTSATALPEASPEHYRLHISNLIPDLDLAHITAALVPRDVKLVGASLFAPRPMGGSRRELVRSLKLAFLTEADAKRCQEWIKKDLGGGVAKVVVPGGKIVVGNPMDPMVSETPPAARDSSVLHANPYALLADEQDEACNPPRLPPVEAMRSPSLVSVASTTATSTSTAGESTSHSSCAPLGQSKQFRISINGIDPSKPVSTVFGTILSALNGAAAEPARMGIRNMDGHRGAEFVFESEGVAKQFVLQAWIAIQDGAFADIAAEGGEVRIARRSG